MTMFFAKKLNKKGFTLAELLIVVAIIAVLIAIAIPIYAGEVKRARIGVHKANARSLKAIGAMEILNSDDLSSATYADVKSFTITADYSFETEQYTNIKIVRSKDTLTAASAKVGAGAQSTTPSLTEIDSSNVATTDTVTYEVKLGVQDLSTAAFSGPSA